MTVADVPGSLRGWREAKAFAIEQHWKLLATGDWSWVYAASHTGTVWRITPFDPAFDAFVRACSASVGNPHLPYIHGHHAHPDGGATTVMERLDELERSSAESWLADLDTDDRDSLVELRRIIFEPDVGSGVNLFMGVDRNPANIMRRPSDGEIVLTDAFWINGPLLLDLVRNEPEEALEHYPRRDLANWAHLPCMDEETTALILSNIDSVG